MIIIDYPILFPKRGFSSQPCECGKWPEKKSCQLPAAKSESNNQSLGAAGANEHTEVVGPFVQYLEYSEVIGSTKSSCH